MPVVSYAARADRLGTVSGWAASSGSIGNALATLTTAAWAETTIAALVTSWANHVQIGTEASLPPAGTPQRRARIRAVRVRWAIRGSATAVRQIEHRAVLQPEGTAGAGDGVRTYRSRAVGPSSSFVTFTQEWMPSPPPAFGPGSEWTWSKVSNAVVRLGARRTAVTAASEKAQIAWVAIDVDYDERPVVSAATPVPGTITTSDRPPIAWTYSDTEGAEQTGFEVRVYRRGPSGTWPTVVWAGGGGGPSPGDAELVATSGVVNSSRRSWTPPPLENGGTYRAWVRVRQEWTGTGEHWSSDDSPGGPGWAVTGEFTLDTEPPGQPLLTATPHHDEGFVRLLVQAAAYDPAATSTGWINIEYRDGDDEPWQLLRGGVDLMPPTTGWHDPSNPPTVALDDYEAPYIAERQYRARAGVWVNPPDEDTVLTSEPTYASAQLVASRATAWITDPLDPASLHLQVVPTEERQRTYQGREVVHRPAGFTHAVVESEPAGLGDQLELLAASPEEAAELAELVQARQTLLFRDDRREHYYFRWAGDRTRTQQGDRRFDHDTFSAATVRVARPPNASEPEFPL